jgi:Carboxypeptidase regulatory-like domain
MRSRASGLFVMGFLAVLCLFFAGMAAPAASAQSTTDGAIGGAVTDQSGAVVPNAIVASRNIGTGSTSSGVTDGSGRYLLIHLQPGQYSMEIAGTGFGAFKVSNITVEVGRVTNIDATLSVKAMA